MSTRRLPATWLTTLLLGAACYWRSAPDTDAPGIVATVPMPGFPAMLHSANVEGEVRVVVPVDANGNPDRRAARVIRSSHELFSLAVMNAVAKWRFEPRRRDRQGVADSVTVHWMFVLNRKDCPGVPESVCRRTAKDDSAALATPQRTSLGKAGRGAVEGMTTACLLPGYAACIGVRSS
ncbi:MAG: Gram-negative bacterial tonB protein [Gemmatimonadetes bacterium]|nr:Gram-negative bacterial tonB protein [Gemmatimonadota bacterium]